MKRLFSCIITTTFESSNKTKRSMKTWKVREIIHLIEANGWFLLRTKGSHRQFRHPTKKGTVTVPGKLSDDLPAGTAKSVLSQAGL